MGNGASSSQMEQADDRHNGKERNGVHNGKERNGVVQTKALAVGAFSKPVNHKIPVQKFRREELLEFLQMQRDERQELDSALGMEETSVDKFRIRPKTAGLRRSTVGSKESDWRKVQVKVESDAACFLCGKIINFIINGYPCRVCTRIFHKECLDEHEGCRAGDRAMMDRAHCVTGWSCYRCGDLTNLLTDDEMRVMIDEFDKRDINRDATISKEEYLRYQSCVYEEEEQEPIPESELSRRRLQYHVMDTDRNGAVDWWEFVNQQCTTVLAKRSKKTTADILKFMKLSIQVLPMAKKHLAQLLTEKESLRLKEQFDAMDDTEDGVIGEFEAKSAYKGYFASSEGGLRRCNGSGEPREQTANVEDGYRFFSSTSVETSGTVSWQEFKEEQALYVLANRPNVRMPPTDWNL